MNGRSLVFSLCCMALSLQEANQATITGFIYDSSQAIVPNATIAIANRDTGQTQVKSEAGAAGCATRTQCGRSQSPANWSGLELFNGIVAGCTPRSE